MTGNGPDFTHDHKMKAAFEIIHLTALEYADAAARSAYLDEACAGDAELRAAVEAGLQRAAEAAEYFGEAVTRINPVRPADGPGEQPGDVVGPCRLLQQIGEGGFGTVWMSDQLQPVRRRVALKIIKPGLDSREIIARFDQERQALALMDHANIARVFDAGTTPSGRPFFVMELIRGTPITHYCDENGLTILERLRLFIQICHAVHHAHQKGIIHRDLKPSNVLVTVNDGEAAVKVIDFGVAKATQGSLSDLTLFTQFHQMIGTPAYMSPEQAEMTSLDIDTRSDIYSLGVMLYELITGRTPIETPALARAGLDEIRRVIREVTPPRPSARVKTLSAEELTTTAKRRRTEGTKLTTTLRGDLDWIAMMCLEKDRKRRYESANALALDLQRYLAHGIVTARPPTASYLLGRIVRRHRVAFIAGAAIALSLVAGIAVSTWLYFKERDAVKEQSRLRGEAEAGEKREEILRVQAQSDAKTARTESERSRRINQFLEEMLKGVEPSVALGQDTALLREIVDKTADLLDSELKEEPEVEAALRHTLGQVYDALGEYPKAEALNRKALALARPLFGDKDQRTIASIGNLGLVVGHQQQFSEAIELLREALRLRQSLPGPEDVQLATCLNNVANVLMQSEQYAEAEPLHLQALEMIRRVKGDKDVRTAVWLQNLGITLRHAGKLKAAEERLTEAVALYRSIADKNDPGLAIALQSLAGLQRDHGDYSAAETSQQEALKIMKKVLGEDHPRLSEAIYTLASIFHVQRKLPDAIALYQACLALRRKLKAEDDADTCQTLTDLGSALRLNGDASGAEVLHRESLEKLRKLVTADHGYMMFVRNALAMDCLGLGKSGEAVTLMEETLSSGRRVLPPNHPGLASMQSDLAMALSADGKHADAVTAQRAALDIQRRSLPAGHPHIATSLNNLAQMLEIQGLMDDAEKEWANLMEAAAERPGKESPEYAVILDQRVKNLVSRQEYARAVPLLQESLSLREKAEPQAWTTDQVRVLLGRCLLAQKNYAAAGPLLTSGAEGLLGKGSTVPPGDQARITEAVEEVVRFYTETGEPEKASLWKKKLPATQEAKPRSRKLPAD